MLKSDENRESDQTVLSEELDPLNKWAGTERAIVIGIEGNQEAVRAGIQLMMMYLRSNSYINAKSLTKNDLRNLFSLSNGIAAIRKEYREGDEDAGFMCIAAGYSSVINPMTDKILKAAKFSLNNLVITEDPAIIGKFIDYFA
ncbi:MAG: hypothetical protein KBD00_02515 [Candidatus Peribacteraceae bacterium]|nr:hypothetical protein [Candidatus Peribacteraceae bacterium]